MTNITKQQAREALESIHKIAAEALAVAAVGEAVVLSRFIEQSTEPVESSVLARQGVGSDPIRAALVELVACKDIQDRADVLHFAGPASELGEGWKAEHDKLRSEYIRRKAGLWDRARAALSAAPAPIPQGFVLVPVEPTPGMLEPFARQWCYERGFNADEPMPPHGDYPRWYNACDGFAEMYRAMLAASPEAPKHEVPSYPTTRSGEARTTDAQPPTNPYAGMTGEQFDAALTAEDPRYPARKAASEALDEYITEWIDGYELDDGECCHSPSDFEQFLIRDAFAGLTSDEEYQRLYAAWKSLCGPRAVLAGSDPTPAEGKTGTAPTLELTRNVLDALECGCLWAADSEAEGRMRRTTDAFRAWAVAALAGNGATERTGQDEQGPGIGDEDTKRLDWLDANNGAWCGSDKPSERYLYHGVDWSSRKHTEAHSLRAAIDSAMAADASTGGRGEKNG